MSDCFACWPFLTVLSQVFGQKCLTEMPELVWVPFPLLGLLELCQLAYLQYGVLCLDLAWLVGIFDGSEIYIYML